MDPWLFGILDGALVAAAALGLGIWQYVSVTREIARDRAARDAREDQSLASEREEAQPAAQHRQT